MTANANLFSALQAGFAADAGAVAIESVDSDGKCYSWREIEGQTARLANFLDSLQIPQGSRIAVQVEKSVQAALLYLATLRAGHVFLPLNTAYQRSEMAYFVGNAQPAVIVCTERHLAWVTELAHDAGAKHVLTLEDDGRGTLMDQALLCGDHHVVAQCQENDLAAIVYTSGTTGRSKGAMLTHGNLLSNATTLRAYWGWQPDDVLIHALPIFHVHGLFVALHGALLNGSKMLWLNKFNPKLVVTCLPRATVFMGVPTLYVRLLAEPELDQACTAKMRLFIAGSAPLLVETFKAWQQVTGHTILERYGMSETIMLTSNPCVGDARYGGQIDRRAGTVGFALPGVNLRVCDDQDKPVRVNDVGNIQVQGPNVFSGYWRMPEKTREEFTDDGYFKTGDVGKVDERGYVTLVGRSKDLIISGGYNVYPAEIEGYINDLPGVAESAVVGAPHPDFGEVGVAVVVAQSGAVLQADLILGALKGQVANFKVPKRCFVVPELPRNAMGKVQKNLLRDRYQSLFSEAGAGPVR